MNRLKDYEDRAAGALVLLENAARCGGVDDATIKIKHDKQWRPYVVAQAGGVSHRIEMMVGDNPQRITHVMQSILAVL